MKKKGKMKYIFIGLIVLVVALILVSCIALPKGDSASQEVKATKGSITTNYAFSGNVEAKNMQQVLAQAPQTIDTLYVADGDVVEEGDALYMDTNGNEYDASIDGTISGISVAVDDEVAANEEIMSVIDRGSYRTTLQVDEYDVAGLSVGKPATITVNALGKDIPGSVSKISDAATNANGVSYFNVEVSIPYQDGLKIGMSVEVKILKAEAQDVLTIPMTALQFNDDNSTYVMRKGSDNKYSKVDVSVGINDGKNVEIQSGLSDGDTLQLPVVSAEEKMSEMQQNSQNGTQETQESSGAAQ